MRFPVKAVGVSAGALMLAGCLVSEFPVLDASSGRAKPLKDGAYIACPVSEEASEDDCQTMTVVFQPDRSYHFISEEEEEPSVLRFRRVGNRGYAVQSKEEHDEFAYYYGAGNSNRMTLTWMMCKDLPENVRTKLLENGDLESDSDDYEACEVKTVRGLTDAARAYHRGQAESDEPITMELTPAPAE
ncbi:hypothetical protein PUV54_07800 [Hyphococcus flavus]|uniref:Lipoprotein n=1 Tax=Hyphococcus flavus TaxID=1866326 RepID=A0AAE9ZDK4_9PROT|nr:hypothetical protein [Hyphococcus flavus]WDI33098.1 hypothetical protein PUV54_07800 [Hyphococcus flavus]